MKLQGKKTSQAERMMCMLFWAQTWAPPIEKPTPARLPPLLITIAVSQKLERSTWAVRGSLLLPWKMLRVSLRICWAGMAKYPRRDVRVRREKTIPCALIWPEDPSDMVWWIRWFLPSLGEAISPNTGDGEIERPWWLQDSLVRLRENQVNGAGGVERRLQWIPLQHPRWQLQLFEGLSLPLRYVRRAAQLTHQPWPTRPRGRSPRSCKSRGHEGRPRRCCTWPWQWKQTFCWGQPSLRKHFKPFHCKQPVFCIPRVRLLLLNSWDHPHQQEVDGSHLLADLQKQEVGLWRLNGRSSSRSQPSQRNRPLHPLRWLSVLNREAGSPASLAGSVVEDIVQVQLSCSITWSPSCNGKSIIWLCNCERIYRLAAYNRTGWEVGSWRKKILFFLSESSIIPSTAIN